MGIQEILRRTRILLRYRVRRYGLPGVGVVLGLLLLIHGMATVKSIMLQKYAVAFVIMCTDPFWKFWENREEMSTPLYYMVGHMFDVSSFPELATLSCSFILMGLAFLIAGLRRTYNKEQLGVFLLLFIAHPLSYTMRNLMGLADPLTVLLMICLFISRSTAIYFLTGIVGALAHTSFLLTAPMLPFMHLAHSRGKDGWRRMVAVMLGCGVGMLLLKGWATYIVEYQSNGRLQYVLDRGVEYWIQVNQNDPLPVIYSLNAILWVPLIMALVYQFRRDCWVFSAYMAIFVCSIPVTYFTADTTRVFGLLTWAPTLWLLIHTYKQSLNDRTPLPQAYAAILLLAGTLAWATPYFYFIGGQKYAPGQMNNILLILGQ